MVTSASVTETNGKPVYALETSAEANGRILFEILAADGGPSVTFPFFICFDSTADDPPILPPVGQARVGAQGQQRDSVTIEFSDPDTDYRGFHYSATSTHNIIRHVLF